MKFKNMDLEKRNAVVYQVYPQSFRDTNGDGIGDIKGITEKLPHFTELGVNYIWISPIFVSPLVDNGYDVADYKKVNPIYGTNEDLYELFAEAKKVNIGIMLDMVWNHSSSEHEWFKKALAGDKKYQDYYYFSEPDKDGNPPSDWNASFERKAWTLVPSLGKYYFHTWADEQPDLNWHNEELRNELKGVAKFWIEKGAKGFRFDVFNLIGKRMDSMHYSEKDGYMAWDFFGNGPDCHKWWQEMGKDVFWEHDILTVGEGNESIADSLWYTMPERHSLHTMFNFSHNEYSFTEPGWKKTLMSLKEPLIKYREVFEKGGHLSVAYNNHDNPRMLNKLLADDMTYKYELATMLVTIQMMWYGNAYIYQGDEFGMTNAFYEDSSSFKDIGTINYLKTKDDKFTLEEKKARVYWTSRDNSRNPIHWNNSEDRGFGSKNPWIDFSSDNSTSLKKDRSSEKSIFSWYKKMIEFRKDNAELIQEGDNKPMYRFDEDIFAFFRQKDKDIYKVFGNFSTKDKKLTDFNNEGEVIINNYSDFSGTLKPYQVVVIKTKSRNSLINKD